MEDKTTNPDPDEPDQAQAALAATQQWVSSLSLEAPSLDSSSTQVAAADTATAPFTTAATSSTEAITDNTNASAAAAAAARKEKGRVRFNPDSSETEHAHKRHAPPQSPKQRRESPVTMPRPSLLRNNSANSDMQTEVDEETDLEAQRAQARARERARQVAARINKEHKGENPDASGSRRSSVGSVTETVNSEGNLLGDSRPTDIPLHNLDGSAIHSTEELEHDNAWKQEAYELVHTHTQHYGTRGRQPAAGTENEAARNEVVFYEINDGNYDGVYAVPAPETYRGSVLSQLLKLYKPSEILPGHRRRTSSTGASPVGAGTSGSDSGTTTPRRKWYENNRSQETLSNLVGASARLANPNSEQNQNQEREAAKSAKGKSSAKRSGSASRSASRSTSRFSMSPRHKEEARITVHIAETLSRQQYLIKLCRALMLVGAPTHRLEEYLSMSARVLEIDGQFLYLPGCMIISFDDRSTHTTEVRIVRSSQGIDLGKLKDVHHIYKDVMHDMFGVEEGTKRLDALMDAKDKFPEWVRVIAFGLTSATAAPFSFKARLIDLPLCFAFGCLIGLLQLVVAPRSQLYSNIFEVSATVLVSFCARALGSIRGGSLFCFSAVAQGGITMLLPGYLVLCSALELQSRAIVPGSIRMVYAVIYSLLLGFGITVGATIYGLVDSSATSATTCENPIPPYYGFIFVPFFSIFISIIYQAKWQQMPVMVIIGFAGYLVNYFSSLRFAEAPQISNTLGALCVGVLANLYSRIRHGVAAAVLIPAIFVQVPGGLASTGGLLSGLTTADQLVDHHYNATGSDVGSAANTVVFNVAASMIQIAIGIAVGLFLSALLIYPLGKRRSGLFSL